MWAAYTKHYFGDFRKTNGDTYSYDVTRDDFLDESGNAGYGFSPRPDSNPNVQQFFFSSLSVYQVYGQQYVQFDLINPKITTFDPDELSYEDSSVSTITMQIAYEAILIKNNGTPQPISSDESLSEAFATRFGGEYLEIPAASSDSFGTSILSSLTDAILPGSGSFGGTPTTPDLRSFSSSVAGGILSTFGDFVFGSVIGDTPSPATSIIPTDLSSIATSDPVLASLLSVPSSESRRSVGGRLARPYETETSLSATALDVATSALEASGGRRSGTEFDAFVSAASSAARITGRSPRDEITRRRGA
jgi:hypothetical protein